jgi:hypothetical protein
LKVRDLVQIERHWSMEEVAAMHELLDGLDWAAAEAVRIAQKPKPKP